MNEFMKAEIKHIKIPNNLTIITWNSNKSNGNNDKQLGTFEISLQKWGVPYTVLGAHYGATWVNINKIKETLLFLDNCETEYILAADSSDVLLVGDINIAFQYYLSSSHKMLFSAEANNWPAGFLKHYQDTKACGIFRYLNSGIWIGAATYIREVLEFCLKLNIEQLVRDNGLAVSLVNSDQIRYKVAYKDMPHIGIDHECRIFQTISRISPWIIQWNQ